MCKGRFPRKQGAAKPPEVQAWNTRQVACFWPHSTGQSKLQGQPGLRMEGMGGGAPSLGGKMDRDCIFALCSRHIYPYFIHEADDALLLLLSQTARQDREGEVNSNSSEWVRRSLEKTSPTGESRRTNSISKGVETHTCFSCFSMPFLLPKSGRGPTSSHLVRW